VPDAADIFKDKPIYDADAAHAAQEEEDFLFWLGQDGSED
jgi:hypothetical protein